jgi:hypothetical protein
MKEELNKNMENLRKKNQIEILEIKSPFNQMNNTVEGHSSRLEQGEERSSGLKDKIDIKEKTEELLVKKIKRYERNMQKLSNSIKRQNLKIMDIKEAEDMQTKRIHDIFNKIIAEISPNLKKKLPIQVQEATRTPNRLDQNRTSLWHIMIKTISTEKEY